jgi:hypothetical protein
MGGWISSMLGRRKADKKGSMWEFVAWGQWEKAPERARESKSSRLEWKLVGWSERKGAGNLAAQSAVHLVVMMVGSWVVLKEFRLVAVMKELHWADTRGGQ